MGGLTHNVLHLHVIIFVSMFSGTQPLEPLPIALVNAYGKLILSTDVILEVIGETLLG